MNFRLLSRQRDQFLALAKINSSMCRSTLDFRQSRSGSVLPPWSGDSKLPSRTCSFESSVPWRLFLLPRQPLLRENPSDGGQPWHLVVEPHAGYCKPYLQRPLTHAMRVLPCSSCPSSGVLRLRECRQPGSTVQRNSGSITMTSAVAPT